VEKSTLWNHILVGESSLESEDATTRLGNTLVKVCGQEAPLVYELQLFVLCQPAVRQRGTQVDRLLIRVRRRIYSINTLLH